MAIIDSAPAPAPVVFDSDHAAQLLAVRRGLQDEEAQAQWALNNVRHRLRKLDEFLESMGIPTGTRVRAKRTPRRDTAPNQQAILEALRTTTTPVVTSELYSMANTTYTRSAFTKVLTRMKMRGLVVNIRPEDRPGAESMWAIPSNGHVSD